MSSAPTSGPTRTASPSFEPERAQPRHLKPEEFGYPAVPLTDDSEAVRAAAEDAQLRVAVQHLRGLVRVPARGGRRR
ncbi:hypothetical protein [Nannocystis pusilla]|uniref:hypothetical protein n=1 Tax=Nannocystis pusilla TaxID=889268 RepID=UPI003DA2D623